MSRRLGTCASEQPRIKPYFRAGPECSICLAQGDSPTRAAPLPLRGRDSNARQLARPSHTLRGLETTADCSPGSADSFQRALAQIGAEVAIMGSRRKPWSKAKVRRVLESIHAGGYSANRSRRGWSVWLSGEGAGPSRRRFIIPEKSLRSRHPRWLGHRLTAAYRRALRSFEGVQMISGIEARDLLRWCTRWARSRHRLTASERARAAKYRRWDRPHFRVPETVQGGGYVAERSRRGWVVRISSYSGRLRGHYLVPFRALRPHGRNWHGAPLVVALERALRGIEGAERTNDFNGSSPTGWPLTAHARVNGGVPAARAPFRSPMAGETWTRHRAS